MKCLPITSHRGLFPFLAWCASELRCSRRALQVLATSALQPHFTFYTKIVRKKRFWGDNRFLGERFSYNFFFKGTCLGTIFFLINAQKGVTCKWGDRQRKPKSKQKLQEPSNINREADTHTYINTTIRIDTCPQVTMGPTQ